MLRRARRQIGDRDFSELTTVGERLAFLVETSPHELPHIAKRARVSEGYLRRLCNGLQVPTLFVAGRLVAVLGVCLDHLLFKVGDHIKCPRCFLDPQMTLED